MFGVLIILSESGLRNFRMLLRQCSDLFVFKGESYVVVTDYYLRYPEVLKLRDTTAKGVTDALKAIFSRHGIPETLVSDNGPQYSSGLFAVEYNFMHVTSSPHYPRSNGHAERSVQTVKNILRKSEDGNAHLSINPITVV